MQFSMKLTMSFWKIRLSTNNNPRDELGAEVGLNNNNNNDEIIWQVFPGQEFKIIQTELMRKGYLICGL